MTSHCLCNVTYVVVVVSRSDCKQIRLLSITRLAGLHSYQRLSAGPSPLRIADLPRQLLLLSFSATQRHTQPATMTGYNFVGDRRAAEDVGSEARCGPGPRSWPPVAAAAGWMTTESGRQRDGAVARRKLNRDYRLVSWSAIIRPARSVGLVPLDAAAEPDLAPAAWPRHHDDRDSDDE